jgi:hypothetical protein
VVDIMKDPDSDPKTCRDCADLPAGKWCHRHVPVSQECERLNLCEDCYFMPSLSESCDNPYCKHGVKNNADAEPQQEDDDTEQYLDPDPPDEPVG